MNLKSKIASQLKKDYMHRDAEKLHCSMCRISGVPLAFHVVEKLVADKSTFPDGFVPLAHSRGFYRGSFPLCAKCAPACKKCDLPIVTKAIDQFTKNKNAIIGNGFCRDHIHAEQLIDILNLKIASLNFKVKFFISLLVGIVVALSVKDKVLPIFFIASLICFLFLSVTVKLLNESHIGYKRLTFVCAVMFSIFIPFYFQDVFDYLSQFVLIGVAIFFVSVALMVYGKKIFLWIREGFT